MRRPHAFPAVVAALMLFVALGDHQYGYFTALRWVVTIAALATGYVAMKSTVPALAWLYVGVAVLFNPLVPVVLDRATWQPIDVLAGLVMAGGVAIQRRPAVTSPQQTPQPYRR